MEAHLVFTGNLSVQFTFSAFCIAFNMSASMCLCLNFVMTPFAHFVIFLQVSSFIIPQKLKLRPCAAHPRLIIVGYFFFISRHAFFMLLGLSVTTPKPILTHSLSNSSITFNISVAIYSLVWLCRSVWKDFQNIGLGWLTTKLVMGSLRMLLHPSLINPTESDAKIVATVSSLILYSESSKGSDVLYLLGTT